MKAFFYIVRQVAIEITPFVKSLLKYLGILLCGFLWVALIIVILITGEWLGIPL